MNSLPASLLWAAGAGPRLRDSTHTCSWHSGANSFSRAGPRHPQLRVPCPCPDRSLAQGLLPGLSHWSLGVVFCFGFWTKCPITEDAPWLVSAFNLEVNVNVGEVREFPHIPMEGGKYPEEG